jgi:hypothetical protein
MFKKKRSGTIKLSGEIDVPNNIVKINPTSGDQWKDFGYWMEATSFMAKQAMLNKGWDETQMKKYIQDYIDKAFVTYTVADDRTDLYKP